MTVVKTGDRIVVCVTATSGGDWQVVSVPTGFEGIVSPLFSANDYLQGFVLHEDGEQWEVYDLYGGDSSKLLQVTSLSGTVTLARPAIPYNSSKSDNSRMDAGCGTHTLTIAIGSGTVKRLMREVSPFWKVFSATDATPSVADYRWFKTNGSTAITRFDDLTNGQRFLVRRGDADITIQHDGANIDLFGEANFVLTESEPIAEFAVEAGVAKQIGGGRGLGAATMSSGDSTPTVANLDMLTTAGSTTITDFDDGREGQKVIVRRGTTDIKIADNPAKIDCGGYDRTLTAGNPVATFISVGGVWVDINCAAANERTLGLQGAGCIYPELVYNDASSGAQTANTARLNAAAALAVAGNLRRIVIGAGAVYVNGTINATDSTLFDGQGEGVTYISPSHSGDVFSFAPAGTNINVQRCGIRNMTVYHTGEPSSGALLHMDRAHHCSISNLELVGGYICLHLESPVHNRFVNVDCAADGQFTSYKSNSALMKINQKSGAAIPAETHFVHCDWRGQAGNYRLDYAVLIQECDGIWFTNCHFGFSRTAGLALRPGTTTSNLGGVYAVNCYLDTVQFAGLVVAEPSNYTGNFGGHRLEFVTVYNSQVGAYWSCASAYKSTLGGGLWSTFTQHGIQISKGNLLRIDSVHISEVNIANGGGHGVIIDGGASCNDIEILDTCIYKGATSYAPAAGITTTSGNTKIVGRGLRFDQTTLDIQRGDSSKDSYFEIVSSDKHYPTYSAGSGGALFLSPGHKAYMLGTANNVTSISSNGFWGERVVLMASGSVTVVNGNNLKIGSDFAMVANSVLELMFDGTNYRQISRSQN